MNNKKQDDMYRIRKNIYLTEEQNLRLIQKSKKLGFSQSQFMRKIINDECIYINLITQLRIEFSRQGNNLNQLVKYINTYKDISGIEEAILKDINCLREEQKEIMNKLLKTIKNKGDSYDS